MEKKQFLFVLALSFIGGIIGGLISERIFTNHQVFAENGALSKIIKANEFWVVDDKGNKLGSFGEDNQSATLSIVKKGKKGGSESIKIDELGMVAELVTPGNYRYEKVKTRFWSLGMIYDEYSKRDLEKNLDWAIDRQTIMIGDGSASTLGPAIQLSDRKGNLRAVLGVKDLHEEKSGSTIQRPPSSLVLFNENGDVIWKTP